MVRQLRCKYLSFVMLMLLIIIRGWAVIKICHLVHKNKPKFAKRSSYTRDGGAKAFLNDLFVL